MFKKTHYYYVTYSYQNNFQFGTGSLRIRMNKKIKTIDDVNEIRDHIRNKYDLGTVVVLNWKILKR